MDNISTTVINSHNNTKLDNKDKPKSKFIIKSYKTLHKSNSNKQLALFDLYSVYHSEFKHHVLHYWYLFKNNKLDLFNNTIKFSHLGSTKHISTQLNASYLQVCLSQSCATLNNYLANINTKFTEIINSSSIHDKYLLHQLRTINKSHSWLNNFNAKNLYYYPNKLITDDYGNLVESFLKEPTLISPYALRLSKQIYNHIIKSRVKFPNLNKPRLIIDNRLYSLEDSKTKSFDYWLHITTLIPNKRISIPIKSNDFFEHANGILGKTIELNFNNYDYNLIKHKHNSLSKKHGKLTKVNKTVEFIFNKKTEINHDFIDTSNLTKTVSFDLGLCNLIATSEGELYGKYWLNKLKIYDKKITDLFSDRQYIFRKSKDKNNKIRSKRYDGLITQVRGFIKSEINRILNYYFDNHKDIKTIIIENLNFNKPELSKRLNRIIKNFGLKIFKDKLKQLSLIKGFKIEELNPAYSSQECYSCGYVDEKNRKTQSKFKCLCCGKELNADIQGAKVNLGRSQIEQNLSKIENKRNQVVYQSNNKGKVLELLKKNFVKGIKSLIFKGKVSRRRLLEIILKNKYFNKEIKEIVKTTEASGIKPMTAENFEVYLSNYYNEKLNNKLNKIEITVK